ncbi:MAG: hypothetical protein WAV15_03535 [Minisyncoccia bacterium]
MKKNNLVRFVQSLVMLPVITTSLGGGIQNLEAPHSVLVQKMNIDARGPLALNQALKAEADLLKAKAEAIDAYFRERGMPLEGHGKGLVLAAEKYGLDYRLLAAIATRETTGGLAACPVTYRRTGDMGYKYNVFGWGSCKIKFKSYEDGFEVLARNLSGNNPNTAHYYEDKTTSQILRAYNPPSIVPHYAEEVISIMDEIGKKDIAITLAVNS